MRQQIMAITRKELTSYFGSPLAIIFLGTFLAATLFIFFTIETFFARGLADIRPLFTWMPILLIFLLAALTMRQWSEEQRAGTQELLLTLPVNLTYLVLGKFLAVVAMIAMALALTLPLPLSIALMGNLDWGPVAGGYLAALLMASAYAAIGLFVSSRTDNQIVALIATVLLGGLFYVLGTRGITEFFGGTVSEILWAIGTGSRFESIQRGVVDLRDLAYYLSLIGFFLMLNVISLDAVRWSVHQIGYRRKLMRTAVLLGANLILLNVWLFPLHGLRIDMTEQNEYSLSATTEELFNNLQEPLLIRAYISERTHPLLAPLVPQIRDMLREYEIAADGRLTAEVVDPATDPELEAEANQEYGIRPSPFQVADRYEASVINSYFDILITYGDQTAVLNFQDLILVSAQLSSEPEVRLRNLEYDLTSAIKKVVFGFQSVDAVLAALDDPVQLTFYVTPNTLPPQLSGAQTTLSQVASDIATSSNGKFIYQEVNLNDPNSGITAQFMQETYGLQPIPLSFFGDESYYAHILLQNGDNIQLFYPPADITEGEVRNTLETALKRSSSGFLKSVGVWSPIDLGNQGAQFGQAPTLVQYNLIREQLNQEYTVQDADLSAGQVAHDIDVLLILGPHNLTDIELFAIDQFLMRGGAVVLAANPFQLAFDQFNGGLALQPAEISNVTEWLANHGITLGSQLVMDRQNQAFPITVMRDAGGFQVQEIQAIDYPYFVDVRPDGMDADNPVMSSLPAVTLNWVAPVAVDAAQNTNRETAVLLRSSNQSWLTSDTSAMPDFTTNPDLGFSVSTVQESFPLAVSVQGQFTSFYNDKPNPFESNQPTGDNTSSLSQPTISQSPESARLVVIGSSSFVEDDVLNLSAVLVPDLYLNNLQFAQNAVDWSVEDLDLLAIRSRGSASRVLRPMTEDTQSFWEIGNYAVALIALLFLYFSWRARILNEAPLILPAREN